MKQPCADDTHALAHHLFNLVEAMAAAQDHERALDLCCAAAADVVGGECGRLFALDRSGTQLVQVAPRDTPVEPPIALYPQDIPAMAEPRAWCAFTGEAAIVLDARHTGTWDGRLLQLRDAKEGRDDRRRPSTSSLIVCPLRVQERIVGVLEISRITLPDGAAPDSEALRRLAPLLQGVAFQAAALIANLSLEERNRELAVRLDQLGAGSRSTAANAQTQRIAAATRAGGLISASPQMAESLDLLAKVADSPVPVLILGETGTGKEVVAQLLHSASRRHAGPFVAQNCAAVPAELLESEMFGHRRGAFTGATADKPGLFDLAEKGTLFLDEIGDMPLALQAKLLRVLQDGEVRAIGATRARKLDVRILAATHNDLRRAVAEGRFREDLYYRLSVFPVTLPPLRDRTGDALLLARAFLDQSAERFGKCFPGLTAAASTMIAGYAWPGNVRELRNAIERAAILCPDGEEVAPAHLPIELQAGRAGPAHTHASPAHASPAHALPGDVSAENGALRGTVSRTERAALQRALAEAGGNVTRAAKTLGLSRRTMHEKLARHGLVGAARTGPPPALEPA